MIMSWHDNVFRITGRLWGESTGCPPVDSLHEEALMRSLYVSYDVSMSWDAATPLMTLL